MYGAGAKGITFATLMDPDRKHIYMEEVQSVVRKGEFTLVCIRTSTGDGCEDLIFDNSKEITQRELSS